MLQNYNFYKVLSVFLENPTSGFGWKELSKKAKLGPPSTKRYLDDMKKENIIMEKKVAGRKLYFANREERKYKMYLTFDVMLKLESSGLVDFLNRTYGFPTIILYGSFATGEATESSDIDIAVITESKKKADVKEFEVKIKKEIQVLAFSKKEFSELRKQNASLFNGILNGKVLSGYVDIN